MTHRTFGRLLSRRETLHLMGGAGVTAFVGSRGGDNRGNPLFLLTGETVPQPGLPGELQSVLFATSPVPMTRATETLACVARPALTEGPYFVDERLNRSDIRSDPGNASVKAGVPLKITFNVNRVSGAACAPLPNALVDIWHCDALGAYSDVANGAGQGNTTGQKFLRGYQITDSNGSVSFTTIYPGYYTGRAVHIHFKIRLFSGSTRTFEFTSQVFFDDSLSDQVFTLAPYNTKAARGTRNNNDGIYSSQVLLSVTSDGQGGYQSSFDIGLSGVPDTIASVATVSAASLTAGSVSSEGIVALFGAGLAASTGVAGTLPLPTSLAGVRVLVRDTGGTERVAPLFFVSPTQINFQIPLGTSAGSATVSVERDAVIVGRGTAVVESVAPALFSANASGAGVIAAQVLRVKADGSQTYEAVAQFDAVQNKFVAIPIDLGAATDQLVLVAYGTGFRNRTALSNVTAAIGGTNAPVTYAGAQGVYAGLDQANITVPRSLAGRGEVQLAFSADNRLANTLTLNIK
jgi:uncharacterized protein (TIGR03437 family)